MQNSHSTSWLNNHYMWIINGFLFLFLFFAFLAPVLMKYDYVIPAKIIYQIYQFLCHQLAFRSWFLFGEQAYYPRGLAGIQNINTYEIITGTNSLDLESARQFIGNSYVGFKVAFCQRDVAIYGSLLLMGIFFQISGKKLHALPWYLWVIVGLLPIGIDGTTQFGGLGISFLSWLPVRESTPMLRTITGALFGFTTGLFLFPLIEETMVWPNSKKLLDK